jgi:FtsP/CotA-like multicopper oxidase with cupredoxin domain
MDGVPFVTQPPIAPGQTFTYAFDLRQSGTYWYRSHTKLQEQLGLFGALVIAPQNPGEMDRLRGHVVVLSDWTDEDPSSVMHIIILKLQHRCPAWGRQRSTATIEKRRRT